MLENLRPFRNIHDAKIRRESNEPFNDIKELGDQPGYLVKESTEQEWWGPPKDLIKKIDFVKKYIASLSSAEIGIADHIPKTMFVLGQKDEHDRTVFTVQEKIIGEPIYGPAAQEAFEDDPEGETANAVREIGKVIKGVVQNYFKTFDPKRGVGQCIEIRLPRNFLYGVKELAPLEAKKIYLIDFAPIYEDEPIYMKSDLENFLRNYPMLQTMFAPDLERLNILHRSQVYAQK